MRKLKGVESLRVEVNIPCDENDEKKASFIIKISDSNKKNEEIVEHDIEEKREIIVDYYDVNDPWIDDSEMINIEPQFFEKDFFVISGETIEIEKIKNQEKKEKIMDGKDLINKKSKNEIQLKMKQTSKKIGNVHEKKNREPKKDKLNNKRFNELDLEKVKESDNYKIKDEYSDDVRNKEFESTNEENNKKITKIIDNMKKKLEEEQMNIKSFPAKLLPFVHEIVLEKFNKTIFESIDNFFNIFNFLPYKSSNFRRVFNKKLLPYIITEDKVNIDKLYEALHNKIKMHCEKNFSIVEAENNVFVKTENNKIFSVKVSYKWNQAIAQQILKLIKLEITIHYMQLYYDKTHFATENTLESQSTNNTITSNYIINSSNDDTSYTHTSLSDTENTVNQKEISEISIQINVLHKILSFWPDNWIHFPELSKLISKSEYIKQRNKKQKIE